MTSVILWRGNTPLQPERFAFLLMLLVVATMVAVPAPGYRPAAPARPWQPASPSMSSDRQRHAVAEPSSYLIGQAVDPKPVRANQRGANRRDQDTGILAFSTVAITSTTLANTLLDDRTGAPIGNAAGTLGVYSGTLAIDQQSFTTDAQGIYSVTFDVPISGNVGLSYSVAGYANQFYERKATLAQATPVALRTGANTLTTHLVPSTAIANQLFDDTSGQAVRNTAGSLLIYSGGRFLETAFATSDADGVYRYTLRSLIDGDVQLEYRNFLGYAQQFYDRAPAIDSANAITLRPGLNTFTTRLVPRATLINTLIDDAGSEPLTNTFGLITAYRGTTAVEQRSFRTDASGVYTVTFAELLNQPIRLEYRSIIGHALQYYDRQLTLAQANPVVLQPGTNRLTTRLLAAPKLVNALLDDVTGQPVPNIKGFVVVGSGARSENIAFTTDAQGIFTATLTNIASGTDVPVRYVSIPGYANQYYDRAPSLDQATSVTINQGSNNLMSRLVRATTLVNTLIDDATGQPITGTSGFVRVVSGTLLLDSQTWKTDATGVFTASMSAIISQSAQLVYDVAGYPEQFYDRKDRADQADALVLHSGVNRFTTRLHATRLVNRLIDDITGSPLGGTFGAVEIYSGTLLLEQQAFKTDSNGVYTATLSVYREQAVQLGYRVKGYPYQFYDRHTLLVQATPLALHNGNNVFDSRLITTRLANTLVSDATGQPIANTAGTLEVYSGTLLLEQRPFTTDNRGAFIVNLDHLLSQNVRLGYNVAGLAHQFYDRKLALEQADPVALTIGQTTLTTRLLASVLVNTLVDDLTGAPIVNTAGALEVYSGTLLLAQPAFRTDASGVYTATFQQLIEQPVRIAHSIAGYPRQFYDRKATLDQAQPIALRIGLSALTTRLSPPTLLVNTLIDDTTGQPIRNGGGRVRFYVGTGLYTEAYLLTDATGTYTMPFEGLLNQDIRLEYRMTGYAFQYAERKLTLDQADLIPVRSGVNRLTTHLLPQAVVRGTLIDDWTGQPMPNIQAWINVHYDGDWQEGVRFTTDASGTFTATFDITEFNPVPIERPLLVEYGGVDGYLNGFYDHVSAAGEATPVTLHSGTNQLTIRFTPKTALRVTFLYDASGEPIRNTSVGLGFEAPNGDADASFGAFGRTNDNGSELFVLDGHTGPDYRIKIFTQDFLEQYYDRTTNIRLAKPVALHPGLNTLTVRLVQRLGIRFANTLLDDATGAPIRNVRGELWVYPNSESHRVFPLATDDQGLADEFISELPILYDYVRLEYHIPGYPVQFYDKASDYAQAADVLLEHGEQMQLTTRLAKSLAALPPGAALITPSAGGTLTNTLGTNDVSVLFAPGSVAEPVSATLALASVENRPPLFKRVGAGFAIGLVASSGAPVDELAGPARLDLRYSDVSIAGLDEQSLSIYFWDAAAEQWIGLPTTSDVGGNRLITSFSRPGRFAVFGRPAALQFLPMVSR